MKEKLKKLLTLLATKFAEAIPTGFGITIGIYLASKILIT